MNHVPVPIYMFVCKYEAGSAWPAHVLASPALRCSSSMWVSHCGSSVLSNSPSPHSNPKVPLGLWTGALLVSSLSVHIAQILVSKRLIKIARKQPGLSSGCSWGPPANLLQPVRLHSESPSLESCHHRQYLTPTTILYFIVCFPVPPLSPLEPPRNISRRT